MLISADKLKKSEGGGEWAQWVHYSTYTNVNIWIHIT